MAKIKLFWRDVFCRDIFRRDERGATAIEYALIASLISIMLIAGATVIGTKLNGTFNNVSAKL